jgi:hypothetical protein
MTDTTSEAVERWAEAHDRLAEKGSLGLYPAWHRQRAYILRTLAAERDALRAEVAALRQSIERARREALEEAAEIALAYSQKRRRDAANAKIGMNPSKRQSGATHGAAADTAYYLHQAIRARAGGAGNE